MQRIFAIILIFILQFQVISGSVFAGDSTSFNPVPITVVAKGAGGVPVGTIIAWPVAQNPADMENWLECNGQSIPASVYPELFAVIGAKVPDFRGLFLRGIGGNAAPLGVQQGDAIRNITGSFGGAMPRGMHNWTGQSSGAIVSGGIAGQYTWQGGGSAAVASGIDASRVVPTAEENRPVNKSVRYLIRAMP